ncbi:PCRF domain-containing protein [bacterium]|uniref:Peptide chain release factor 1 n=2 Tax=Katanobacteria TaxID=422282 RepID=A0A2M7X582_UNCKA|nr:PCRF domain-containing protein [bacterium]PIP56128.1 MAG: peptide chain release factor 1 [candidate division WWE3 bacterium CG22_combo_CG10-13_8_21_14_all_39_12]PJA41171.1 MAG: peptide chain release factor 1 [candidate division WWE3 bacterium CG_4_9_14_3_um_filter_39_7]
MDATAQLEEQIKKLELRIKENEELALAEPEMAELATQEIENLIAQKTALEQSILAMSGDFEDSEDAGDLEDAEQSKIAIVEIRSAAGGDEAGLFASELYRMYVRFAETQNWKISQLSLSEGGIGNIKLVSFEIKGTDNNPAYPLLQYESGVHRVQRVPSTESSGRVHTSTVTVAVFPKVSPKAVDIQPQDLKIDVFRSSGPGGQSVNTTDSAVRITHIPTGVVVSMQDEKSQHKNKEKAMNVLASRLYDMLKLQQKEKVDDLRSDQIGGGQRSEKIRTYNFPQDRITDHRIKKNWHGIERIMGGELSNLLSDVREGLEL